MKFKNRLFVLATFLISSLSSSSFAFAQGSFCAQYAERPDAIAAIEAVAAATQYSLPDLCLLKTLSDIQVVNTSLYDSENELIEHVLVTLHYETYSCDYFVRKSDHVITQKRCYNTW